MKKNGKWKTALYKNVLISLGESLIHHTLGLLTKSVKRDLKQTRNYKYTV